MSDVKSTWWKNLGLTTVLVGFISGCATGPMNIDEVYYLGASNGKDRVYYRVTLKGKSRLGVAEFRQGWFSAYAVDALFGDVSSDAAKEQMVREELRIQIDTAMILARSNYLAHAVNPKISAEELQPFLDAVRRVRLSAQDSLDGFERAVVMEYHPNRDLVMRHSDEKLVLVLSSNPDEIITKLSQLSESSKTEQTIEKFVQVLAFRERANMDQKVQDEFKNRARLSAKARDLTDFEKVLAAQIDSLVTVLDEDSPNRDIVLGQLEGLIQFLESFPSMERAP